MCFRLNRLFHNMLQSYGIMLLNMQLIVCYMTKLDVAEGRSSKTQWMLGLISAWVFGRDRHTEHC